MHFNEVFCGRLNLHVAWCMHFFCMWKWPKLLCSAHGQNVKNVITLRYDKCSVLFVLAFGHLKVVSCVLFLDWLGNAWNRYDSLFMCNTILLSIEKQTGKEYCILLNTGQICCYWNCHLWQLLFLCPHACHTFQRFLHLWQVSKWNFVQQVWSSVL